MRSFSRVLRILALMSFTSAALLSQNPTASGGPLRKVVDVPMPGPAVRFDYQSLDRESGRLYIAHMNANQLVVFDTTSQTVVAALDGFARIHGVIAVPELGRVYASLTGEHKVAIVDAKTLKITAKSGLVDYPDGLAYAPGAKRVFVSDEHGKADAVIDVGSNALAKMIPLGGEAGNTVYEPKSAKILVAVHESNELVAIDPRRMEITERHKIPGVEEPHGIALDAENRLAFVAGQGNNTLALVDLDSFRVLGSYPIGKDPDVLSFDPGLKQLYVSAESGEVWIYREAGRTLAEVGHFSMPHAHSVCVDPKTHLVYFPLENVQGRPVLRIMEPVIDSRTGSKPQ